MGAVLAFADTDSYSLGQPRGVIEKDWSEVQHVRVGSSRLLKINGRF